jgi:hypothetical protein
VNAAAVTAIIVTRGDVDLEPILATLPYGEVLVWNNSTRPVDEACFGRYLAIAEASHDIIYFQDDDLIFTGHEQLLAVYEPGKIAANMPSPWYERTGYKDLNCAQVGAGAILDRHLPDAAINRYLSRWPKDVLFLAYCDDVVGMLTPWQRYDFGYEILPVASAPGRISTSEGSGARQAEMRRRALSLRT